MKPFEIFRPGRHTPMRGEPITFGEDDLAATAAGYDPALHQAPIVVGHPKTDAPAYGWVDRLDVVDGRLIAVPADVDAAFADLVREGRFRSRSAAFYRPDQPGNPRPGTWYLRHVGFLGAEAPAVKGLKAVAFAGEDDGVEFAAADWAGATVANTAARVFRRIRDWFIAERGVEAADGVVPDWEIESITQAATRLGDAAMPTPATAAYADNTKETIVTQTPAAGPTPEEIAAREQALAAREAAFAEREAAARAAEDAAFVGSVVAAGRLPKGLAETATALFAELGAEPVAAFAEGDAERSPRAAFRALLSALPVPVATGAIAGGDDESVDFADPVAVAGAIAIEVKAAADRGETLSPADAVARLQTRRI